MHDRTLFFLNSAMEMQIPRSKLRGIRPIAIERFIFNAAARPGTLHEPANGALVDQQVGHSTEMLDVAVERFPALDERDS
jgi:hypothetical protein